MKHKLPVIAIIIFSHIAFISCDDTLTNQDVDNKLIPTKNVSYQEHIQPVFQVKCSNANCHNSASRAGGLNLDNYGEATSNLLVIFPGMPENSKLVWVIEGRTTTPMPPIGWPPMTKNQVEGVKTWIKEGAKFN